MRALAVAIAAALLLAAPVAHGDDLPQLVGTVGPGFTIVMTDATGKKLDVVTAGRYQVLVHDEADIHNFVLGKKETGERPITTDVEFVGDETFMVNLTPGHWVYACSPHFQTMFGSFVVVPATPPAATVRTMRATLTATGAHLSATRAAAGQYAISVTDRSKTRGFRLAGPGVARRTAKAFVGTTTWRVTLARGSYRYGTDLRLTGLLKVS
jgi:hypothetical protein